MALHLAPANCVISRAPSNVRCQSGQLGGRAHLKAAMNSKPKRVCTFPPSLITKKDMYAFEMKFVTFIMYWARRTYGVILEPDVAPTQPHCVSADRQPSIGTIAPAKGRFQEEGRRHFWAAGGWAGGCAGLGRGMGLLGRMKGPVHRPRSVSSGTQRPLICSSDFVGAVTRIA